MNQLVNVKLPATFQSSLFFPNTDTISFELHDDASDVAKSLFVYDILFYYGLEHYKPWEDPKRSVPLLFEEWEKNKEVLAHLFNERKRKEAKPIMVMCVAYLTMSLHWVNGKPVASLSNVRELLLTLTIKPVNCLERLSYIMEAPDHYHSYIQLTQLFDELKKQFYKSLMMKKKPD